MKMNDETKSEKLKHQFSQLERDLNLQEMFKLIPIPKKNIKNYFFVISCTSAHESHIMSVYKAFIHTHCTLRNNVSFNVKKCPIQHSICFKLVLPPLVPGSLSKMTLNV
jgi:hypothetical protein